MICDTEWPNKNIRVMHSHHATSKCPNKQLIKAYETKKGGTKSTYALV